MADDDGIPTLTEVVRPGPERRSSAKESDGRRSTALTDAEIEAIASKVMDRYEPVLERTLARAIRRALLRKEAKTPARRGK